MTTKKQKRLRREAREADELNDRVRDAINDKTVRERRSAVAESWSRTHAEQHAARGMASDICPFCN